MMVKRVPAARVAANLILTLPVSLPRRPLQRKDPKSDFWIFPADFHDGDMVGIPEANGAYGCGIAHPIHFSAPARLRLA